MDTFKIPVSWEMSGIIEIQAETLEKAIKLFDKDPDIYDLPEYADYVDGSFTRSDEEFIETYNGNQDI